MRSPASPTRPRPYRSPVREAAAAATAARIVEAAIDRFSTDAYETVALDDVARDAGVSVRTVIRRFGSKDELFSTAARTAGERVIARRNQAPVGDVRAAVRNLLEHYEQWGDQRLLMIAQEDRIPAVRRHAVEGRAFHREWVERTFAPQLERWGPAVREHHVLALIAATDVYVWKLLRRDLDLSLDDTQGAMEALIAPAREGER